jgi:hypothetical protein
MANVHVMAQHKPPQIIRASFIPILKPPIVLPFLYLESLPARKPLLFIPPLFAGVRICIVGCCAIGELENDEERG